MNEPVDKKVTFESGFREGQAAERKRCAEIVRNQKGGIIVPDKIWELLVQQIEGERNW